MAPRTTKHTPSAQPVEAQEPVSDAGYVEGIPPPPPQPRDDSGPRPDDAGWVGGTAAELAARTGPYKGGDRVFDAPPEVRKKASDPAPEPAPEPEPEPEPEE